MKLVCVVANDVSDAKISQTATIFIVEDNTFIRFNKI